MQRDARSGETRGLALTQLDEVSFTRLARLASLALLASIISLSLELVRLAGPGVVKN